MKILSSNKKKFETELNNLLELRKKKIKNSSSSVINIIKDVQKNGDRALIKYEKRFNRNSKLIPSKKQISKTIKKGSTLTAIVSKVDEAGIEVDCDGVKGFIKRSDLSRDRNEQRPERFSEGDKIDAKVVNLDKSSRKMSLSIKALELAEEKEAVEQYGSTDSGASLGDILGAALKDQDKKS